MATSMNLGTKFDARAINIADRLDVKGIEPRVSTMLPVAVDVGKGCAVLLRSGVVVFFGVEALAQEGFLHDLEPRMQNRIAKPEVEKVTVRIGEADGVEPDVVIVGEVTVERLQVIAVILAKSVVLAHNETAIRAEFDGIEPLAQQMKQIPRRLPWKQRDLVRRMGESIAIEHALVDRAEVLEKPDLLWDRPDLDRLYTRLEDEYEIRERHHVLESKLAVVTNTARTMLELTQAKRSLSVEYYIVALIVLEVFLTLYELFVRPRI